MTDNPAIVSAEDGYGQSFVAWPPDDEPHVLFLSVGFPTYGTAGRADTCFIYDAPLNDPSQIGTPANLVAASDYTNDTPVFGPAIFSRNYIFKDIVLNPGSIYYAYFSDMQIVCIDNQGGGFTDFDFEMQPGIEAMIQVAFDKLV